MSLQSTVVPFFVRGVVYQVTRTLDPISDDCLPQIKRDIPLFKELGLNTLFVLTKVWWPYDVDSSTQTVASPSCGISRHDPDNSYNVTTMTTFFKVADLMAQYPNTLGLLVGAELINDVSSIAVTPFLRAAVRDLKTYMKLRNDSSGQRVLPIGYAAGQNDRSSLFDLSSGDSSSSIDFLTACTNR
nr:1,3-beta-glucanosyltransferase gel1 [Quercus suber]